MATIKTFSQISQSMMDGLELRQPTLDTKPGSVARDIVVDNPADQIASVYRDINAVQKDQSILNSTGQTVDRLGSNFGITRDSGKRAAGNAILTFSSLNTNITIQSGSTITAKTGVVFRVTANIIISSATKGFYSSYANSIADQLHIAGISDQYALQVPIEAINVGANGNIPAYSLVRTSIQGISNVTNIAPTAGGSNPQGDSQYKNQIFAGLSGSSAGTNRGYRNALLAVSGVQSVYIASPGNPILTRDGTITRRNTDGSLTVLSPGTGGKVDIWVHGSNLVNISESYVFHDLSGTGDITSPANAHILGQTTDTAHLTSLERRQLYVNGGQLPLQPVDSVISLSGSVSGANFVNGVNYEVVHDLNPETQNTAFALDSIVFLQDYIGMSGENVAKGSINSVDTLVFSGIKSVDSISQSIIITNDLASLDVADHTKITMPHHPISTVLRATNLTTGERYMITDQNLDDNTGLNETGDVFVNGSVLPSSQDLIQADYTWVVEYDHEVDYFSPGNVNFTTTGIDWGRSNFIQLEPAVLIRDANRYELQLTRDVDRVYSAFYCDTQSSTVQEAILVDQTGVSKSLRQVNITTGSGPVVFFVFPALNLITSNIVPGDIVQIYVDAAAQSRVGIYTVVEILDANVLQVAPIDPPITIQTANVTVEMRASDNTTVKIPATAGVSLNTTAEDIESITNVLSVRSQTTGLELYATEAGGTFSGTTVYLATDVDQPDVGEEVLVYFNTHEVFNIAKNNGTVAGDLIILSTDDVLEFNSVKDPLDDIFNGESIKPLFVNYITEDIDIVVRTAMDQLPFIGSTATSTLVNKNNVLLDSRQPTEFDISDEIVRNGPAYLGFVVDGALSAGGTLSIRGTGWIKIETTIPVSQINVGGNFDLRNVITSELGTLSGNYSVVKVASASIDNGVSIKELMLRGYVLADDTYDAGVAQVLLGASPTSVDFASIFAQNDLTLLTIGSRLTITFYVLAPNISEVVQFTSGRGNLYTRYKYTRVDRIDLISGFINPSNSTITGYLRVMRLSQPASSSTYLADYNYFGPVENERITIQYRYNSIIQNATDAIENVRTLTSDVLTRLSEQILVNVSMDVILDSQATNQQNQVLDQAISAVTNLINNNPMGVSLDYSALLRVVTAIDGVAGADVLVFDYVGSDFDGTANRKNIHADVNQYLFTGTILITPGTR